jgi:Acetyltransferase (GNAT) domain
VAESSVMTCGIVPEVALRMVEPPSAQWLRDDEEPDWDTFVGEHPCGLVYHLSAWKNVLHTAFPHIRGSFLVLRDSIDGRILAGMPVYTVKSWLLGRRISSLPFSSFCDPLIASGEQFGLMLPELEAVLQRTKSRVAEVRTTRTGAYLAEADLDRSSTYKHHYLSLDRDLDETLRGFSKSSVRQKIQQAERAGVIVEEQDSEDGLKLCHNILAATRSRRALPVLPYVFFRAMGERLRPQHLKVFVAYQGRQPVAFHLILRFKDLWISEYSGNTDEAQNGVNQLLYWDSIKRAHADGAKTFSLGRTSSSNEGLLSYKRRWAPVEEDLTEFNLYPEAGSGAKESTKRSRENSMAYRLTRALLSRAPAPLSRMIGNYCYRHLG